ncbi:hypothetical protein FQZ97_938720 [compost metagenome]
MGQSHGTAGRVGAAACSGRSHTRAVQHPVGLARRHGQPAQPTPLLPAYSRHLQPAELRGHRHRWARKVGTALCKALAHAPRHPLSTRLCHQHRCTGQRDACLVWTKGRGGVPRRLRPAAAGTTAGACEPTHRVVERFAAAEKQAGGLDPAEPGGDRSTTRG